MSFDELYFERQEIRGVSQNFMHTFWYRFASSERSKSMNLIVLSHSVPETFSMSEFAELVIAILIVLWIFLDSKLRLGGARRALAVFGLGSSLKAEIWEKLAARAHVKSRREESVQVISIYLGQNLKVSQTFEFYLGPGFENCNFLNCNMWIWIWMMVNNKKKNNFFRVPTLINVKFFILFLPISCPTLPKIDSSFTNREWTNRIFLESSA